MSLDRFMRNAFESTIEKVYGKINSSQFARAAVDDMKNITTSATDMYQSGKDAIIGAAGKSELVGAVSAKASDVANSVKSNQHVQKGVSLVNQGQNYANTRWDQFSHFIGGSETIDSPYKRTKLKNMLIRTNNDANPDELGELADRAYMTNDTAGFNITDRLNWRYRKLNGDVDAYKITRDATMGLGAGAAAYGAVSYFGDDS